MIQQSAEKQGKIQYGDSIIYFGIEQRLGDVPKMLIKVYPDLRVTAFAPPLASYDEIVLAVKKRARWVFRQLRYFEQQRKNILPRRYVSGESHFYLGRRHVLKVLENPACKPSVKLLHGLLQVVIDSAKPEKIKTVLLNWYKARARKVFACRLNAVISTMLWIQEKPPISLF